MKRSIFVKIPSFYLKEDRFLIRHDAAVLSTKAQLLSGLPLARLDFPAFFGGTAHSPFWIDALQEEVFLSLL